MVETLLSRIILMEWSEVWPSNSAALAPSGSFWFPSLLGEGPGKRVWERSPGSWKRRYSAREGMADVGSSLTPIAGHIAWALGASLAQVAPGESGSQPWRIPGNARQTGSVPRTILVACRTAALSAHRTRVAELQEAIDTVIAARLRANAPKRPSRLERLYARSFHHPLLSNATRLRLTFTAAHRSSLALAGILTLSLLLNILDLTLIADAPKLLLFGVNLAVTLLAIGVWFVLHSRLRRHGWSLPHRQVHLRG